MPSIWSRSWSAVAAAALAAVLISVPSPAAAAGPVTGSDQLDAPVAVGLDRSVTPARGKLSLNWAPVPGATSYETTAVAVASGSTVSVTTTAPKVTVSGLSDDTSYDVSVVARNSATVSHRITVRETTLGPLGPPVFTDVPAAHTYRWEMTWLASIGVSTGYADGTFRPGQPVLREQMAAFLYRMAGRPDVTLPASSPFSDVSTTQTFYKEMVWLVQAGITTGYQTGAGKPQFRPGQPVLREQMAAFLYRFAGKPETATPTTPPFLDVPVTHPFAKEIAWLASTVITTGYEDGTYRISQPVLREQMAAFLYRYRQL